MQEYIINGLLIVVALLAVILQIIGTRSPAGLDQKTKSDVVADSDCYGSAVNFARSWAQAHLKCLARQAAGYVWLCSWWIIWSWLRHSEKAGKRYPATVGVR